MSGKETVTVVQAANGLGLQTSDGKTHGWPKKLRPDDAETYIGKSLEITRTGMSVESVKCADPAWELPVPDPKPPKQNPSSAVQGPRRPQSQRRSPDQPKFARTSVNPVAGTSGSPRTSVQQSGGRAFVNPYNFIPFAGNPSGNPQGLEPDMPLGHDRLAPGTFTGVLDVTVTTESPLLLVDQSRARVVGGHKTLPVKIDGDDRPRLAASAVRGMLRAAYEAVTNSAFGVFDRRWERPLAMRNPARSALGMRLARVSEDRTHLLLQPDLDPVEKAWRTLGDGDLLPDPWIPLNGKDSAFAHGSVHTVVLTLWHHRNGFYFWRGPGGSMKSAQVVKVGGRTVTRKVCGVAYSTGWSIRMKHDDRLFITDIDGKPATHDKVDLTEELQRSWRSVLDSYLASAKDRKEVKNSKLPYVRDYEHWVKLAEGALCFAKLSEDESGVDYLSPAMIGRTPFDHAPVDLTQAHNPAGRLDQLTPAERVFGWVNDKSAYAGQLRIEQPVCTTDDWRGRDTSAEPLELATLNGPKPTYYRFYVTGDDTEDKSPHEGFTVHESLRGWKTYVHHKELPEDFEEHVRVRTYTDGNSDRQPSCKVTMSVRNWVKPKVSFTTRIWVENLSGAEFGALIWLLHDGRFRLGLAKPLGFGTVTTTVDGWNQLDPASRYLGADAPQRMGAAGLAELAVGFEHLWSGRDEHLVAYRQAMQGWSGAQVRYPRVGNSRGATPEGQPGYKWFVENERLKERRRWLPEISEQAPTLPWYQTDLSKVSDAVRTAPCTRAQPPKPQSQPKPQPQPKSKPQPKSQSQPGSSAPARRVSGTVKSFNAERGFGHITDSDGHRYFFRQHDSDQASQHAGKAVTFEPFKDAKGSAARKVRAE